MKAGIFDPYLDTIGGGERYCLTVAEALLKKGWQVDIFWPEPQIKQKIIEKLSLEIDRVNFVFYSPRENNLLNKHNIERKYDLLFYLSDGSIPMMFGKRNILHFQVPFKKNLKKTLKNDFKLKSINQIVCNSFFTKKVIDEKLHICSTVIYPPVDTVPFKALKKENIIVSVGRFSQLLQEKRQDILIEIFKELIRKKMIKGWKLVLAGGSEIGGETFLEKLRGMVENYPIEIIKNPSFGELTKLYGKSKIFWTASGYGVDEEREPERVEHFGIATVEGMAAGCVPIVLGKGGQKEIIEDEKNGYVWNRKEELEEKTRELINNPQKIQQISKNAILRSKDFDKEKFYQAIYRLSEL